MRLLFFVGKTAIANLKHVWVVPAAWTAPLKVSLTLLEVVLDA